MTRRAILLALAAARAVAADPAREVWDLLAGMANALADSDATTFLFAIDPSMPGFDSFRLAIRGLLNEVAVNSSISPVENDGDAHTRTLVVDWSMHMVDLNDVEEITTREANVTMKLERRRARWKVVSFQPADFFRRPAHGGVR
jgi:hypothetical protein